MARDRATASLVTYTCPKCHGFLWAFDRPPAELKDREIKARICPYCDSAMTRMVRPLKSDKFTAMQDLLRVD